jgi:hypothetical protein
VIESESEDESEDREDTEDWDDEESGESNRENLYDDLYERLDDYEAFVDFGKRPIGEMVQRIGRDFGIEPDWQRWSTEP